MMFEHQDQNVVRKRKEKIDYTTRNIVKILWESRTPKKFINHHQKVIPRK